MNRKAAIQLAASLPVGDPLRRDLLTTLRRASAKQARPELTSKQAVNHADLRDGVVVKHPFYIGEGIVSMERGQPKITWANGDISYPEKNSPMMRRMRIIFDVRDSKLTSAAPRHLNAGGKQAVEELTEKSLTKYLRDSGESVSVRSLAYAFDLPTQKVTRLLTNMVKKGILVKNRKLYSLAR